MTKLLSTVKGNTRGGQAGRAALQPQAGVRGAPSAAYWPAGASAALSASRRTGRTGLPRMRTRQRLSGALPTRKYSVRSSRAGAQSGA